MNGVAPTTTAIASPATAVPVAGALLAGARGQAKVLAFPDLLGELVASIADEPTAEEGAQPQDTHAGVRDRGDGEPPKGKKAERLAGPGNGVAIGLVQNLAGAPAALPFRPPLWPTGGTTVDPAAVAEAPSNAPADGKTEAAENPAAAQNPEAPAALPAIVAVELAVAAGTAVRKSGEAIAPLPFIVKARAAKEKVAGAVGLPIAPLEAIPLPVAEPRRTPVASGVAGAGSRSRETNGSEETPHREPPVEKPGRNAEQPVVRTDVAPAGPGEEQAGDDRAAAPVAADPAREMGPAPVAFEARLAPSAPAAPGAPAPAEAPIPSPAPAAPDASVAAASTTQAAAEAPRVERVRKPEAPAESDRGRSSERQDVRANAPARDGAMVAEAPAREVTGTEPSHAEPATPRPAEMREPVAVRPPAAEPIARDIRLELADSGRRVEVRLEERAGEVRVSVRTPDGALADTLRDHLPALSARLEQSGFRADQWRAADGPVATRPIDVPRPAGGGVSEGREHQPGGGGEQSPREQSGRQRQPDDENQSNRNQKGKSFAWLMSSFG